MTSGGFLLDTNVLSELVAAAPAPQVVRWMAVQEPGRLFLSVVTLGELTKGVARLDPGRRRDQLARWLAEDLTAQFAGRVLTFDQAVAVRWGEMMAEAERRAGLVDQGPPTGPVHSGCHPSHSIRSST